MKRKISATVLVILITALGTGLYLEFDTKQKTEKITRTNRASNFVEDKKNEQKRNRTIQRKKNKQKRTKNNTSSATLAAVGDILIHDTVYLDAKTKKGYDFKPMFEPIKKYIEKADIAFANQESLTAGKELQLSGYPTFNGPKTVADAVKWVGFDIVNMANNHTLDRGEAGVKKSINYWENLGIEYIGANLSPQSKRVKILKRDNIKFGFLGYTYGTNGIPTPEGKDYLVNRIDIDQITKDIKKAKQRSDLVVVSLHFGTQYQTKPNYNQQKITKQLSQAGADIILGHHPHVLQPIRWIKNKDNEKTLVAYSLGNFLSGQIGTKRNIGGILKLKAVKNKKTNQTKIKKVDFIPTYTSSKQKNNFKIVPLTEAKKYGLKNSDYWQKKVNEILELEQLQ